MSMRLRLLIVETSIFLTGVWPGHAGMMIFGLGKAPTSVYTDFCSQPDISCSYAFSVHQRLVSTNTIPATLTRISDGATFNLSYTGSTFKVNTAAAVTFCLANGGTTTAMSTPAPGSVQYNDCGFSVIYDQVANACTLYAGGSSTITPANVHLPLMQVRNADNELAIIQPTAYSGVSTSAKYLFNTGCNLLNGSVAKSLVTQSSNAFFSVCCGEQEKIENTLGTTVGGSMWAAIYYLPLRTILKLILKVAERVYHPRLYPIVLLLMTSE
jgi:hypothetical protein